jgi:hypothetical protein
LNALFIPIVWWFLWQSCSQFSCRRCSVLSACAILGCAIVGITEILSAFVQLGFYPVLCAWILVLTASIAFWRISRRRVKTPSTSLPPAPPDLTIWVCRIAILSLVFSVGLIAILAPPNTWDSMTYHMARVANWVQHRTVGHYQTPILRQLYLAPFSEFVITQLQILIRSDRLATLVQYSSMLGSVVGVTCIARTLNVSRRGQLLTALFVAALPIGILEASSTQTDYVAAFWVVCCVNAGMTILYQPKDAPRLTLFTFAAAAGLGFLTKSTTALFIAPFAGWVFAVLLRRSPMRFFKSAGAMAAILLLLNFGHLYRNQTAFGKALGPDSETLEYKNSIHTPGALASNIMRNVCMNIGMRGTGRLTNIAYKLIPKISGLDLNDPRITWMNSSFAIYYSKGEDDAGNPMQLIMGSIAIAAGLIGFRRNIPAAVYALCILGGIFIFCYELRWQPYITRLQLPLFVIMAPLFGIFTDRLKSQYATIGAAMVLTISTIPYFTQGAPRKLTGPGNVISTSHADQYFSGRPLLADSFKQAGQIMRKRNPKTIAICSGVDSWEYAVRVLVPGAELDHVNVTNESQSCPTYSTAHLPDALVVLDSADIPLAFGSFKTIYKEGIIQVLVPVSAGHAK